MSLKDSLNKWSESKKENVELDSVPMTTEEVLEILNGEEEEDDDEIDYIQWEKVGKKYFPMGKVKFTSVVKPGIYDIAYHRQREVYYAIHKKLALDELFAFPDPIQDKILKDIKTFWERKEQFKKYKYAYKRGILIYGSAGNGKSSIINLLCKELVEKHKGVIFFLNTPSDLEPFIQFVQFVFKQIQPDTKIICVIEDIEAFTKHSEIEGRLLNLLDGMNRMENIVTIASTNYPEELKERLLNRPSRFDRRYEIKNPNAIIREAYFKHKLKEDNLKEVDLKQWIKETKGLTISHLGEIVKSVFALGNSFEETVKELKKMKNKISSFDFNKNNDDEEKYDSTSSTPGISKSNKYEGDDEDHSIGFKTKRTR